MIFDVGFFDFEKMTFLEIFDMYLMIFDIFSQYLVRFSQYLVDNNTDSVISYLINYIVCGLHL